MTPCEKLGCKVGDKFKVVAKHHDFAIGSIVTLHRDDGTLTPVFKGKGGSLDNSTSYATIGDEVEKVVKPIIKSKRQLAQLLIEAGVTQFPEGANWAAQDKVGTVCIYTVKPVRDVGDDCWNYKDGKVCSMYRYYAASSIPNWHQTVLSRDEFDQIVAETAVPARPEWRDDETVFVSEDKPDSDGWIEWSGGEKPQYDEYDTVDTRHRAGHIVRANRICDLWWDIRDSDNDIIAYRLHKPEPQYREPVTRSIPEPTTTPTLDQLLQDWRNADDYTQRKQTEADEAAAMRDERWQAVQARAGEMGVTVGQCEPAVDGGWIEWSGGNCPVARGTLVDIRVRDGREKLNLAANMITGGALDASYAFWRHDGFRGDIVAYRLARP